MEGLGRWGGKKVISDYSMTTLSTGHLNDEEKLSARR